MTQPLVSVLMTTYNPDKTYFSQAIESILEQTYKNFEVILVDDGSQFDVEKIVKAYDCKKIRYYKLQNNVGITRALNIGLQYCEGKYIARMDDDDICLRQRLEKQVLFMESNPDVHVLGCNKQNFGFNSNVSHIEFAKMRGQQQVELFFKNAGLPHPSVMLRKSFLDEHKIRYNESYKKAQDYRLWVECVKYTRLYCLPEILLMYRCHEKQISSSSGEEQTYYKELIKFEQLSLLGIKPDDLEKEIHLKFCDDNIPQNQEKEMLCWAKKLYKSNCQKQYFEKKAFAYGLYVKVYINLKTNNKITKLLKSLAVFNVDVLRYFIFKKRNKI